MEKMIGQHVNEFVALHNKLKLAVAASCLPVDECKKDKVVLIDDNYPVKFSYEIMSYDPIYKEQDWAACPKSREEALTMLRELRRKNQLYSYWVEAHCADAFVRNELLQTDGRYTPPVCNHDTGWVDITDDDLTF